MLHIIEIHPVLTYNTFVVVKVWNVIEMVERLMHEGYTLYQLEEGIDFSHRLNHYYPSIYIQSY